MKSEEYCESCKYQQCFMRGMTGRSLTCQREKDDVEKWNRIQKEKRMRLVYRFEVVCQQGVSSYYIGREVDGGIIAKIEDHTWEHVDGEISVCLCCKDENDKTIVSVYGAPVAIEYLKEQ